MASKTKPQVTNLWASGILGKLVILSTTIIVLWVILLATYLRIASTHIVGIIDVFVLIDFLLWVITGPLYLFHAQKNRLLNTKSSSYNQPSTLSKTLVIVLMVSVILLAVIVYIIFRLLTSQDFTLPPF